MRNLTPGQTIALGLMCLFGIPICAGLAIGYFAGSIFAGVIVAVVAIMLVATIALRWWERRARQQDKHEDTTNETKERDIK